MVNLSMWLGHHKIRTIQETSTSNKKTIRYISSFVSCGVFLDISKLQNVVILQAVNLYIIIFANL